MDLEQWINQEIELGNIDNDGKPLKCQFCGCKDFKQSGGYEEYTVTCDNCKKTVGHWAYGSWSL